MIPLGLTNLAATAIATRMRFCTGVALMVFAVAVNVPFALLAVNFGYPDILRAGAGEVLARFHAEGPGLVAQWYGYALVALAFVPVSFAVGEVLGANSDRRLRFATILGVLAGIVQALGLLRWVFVVPRLAEAFVEAGAGDPSRAAVSAVFEGLHQFLGVALGEHLGQSLTAAWTALIAWRRLDDGVAVRGHCFFGLAIATCLAIGLAEGFATVLDFDPGLAALATPIGYVAWSIWVAMLGWQFARQPGLDRSLEAFPR